MVDARVTGLGGGVALGVLLAWAPRPRTALRELTDVAGATDPAVPVVAAAALAAWALAAWLVLAVLLTVLGRAPGRLGQVARRLARRWVPTAMRSGLELALGLTVATGVLGAGTGHAAVAVPSPTAGTGHAAVPVPSPIADRAAAPPSTADAAPSPGGADATATPSFDLDWPTGAPVERASSTARVPAELDVPRGTPVLPRGTPTAPATEAPSAAPPPARASVVATATTPASPQAVVVVQPGDTLWELAAASLKQAGVSAPSDACIARTWPRWWAANREVIGPDPDLILPGMSLSPPADAVPVRPGS